MSDEPQVLTQASGVKVVAIGQRVILARTDTGPYAIAAFVLGLLTANFAIGGIAILAVTVGEPGLPTVGIVLTAIGAVVGFGFFQVIKHIRAQKAKPLDQLPVVVTFDLANGVLLGSDGGLIAPLAQVKIGRAFQIGSSSPALVARFPAGSLKLVKGNPFAGGVRGIEATLRGRGIQVG